MIEKTDISKTLKLKHNLFHDGVVVGGEGVLGKFDQPLPIFFRKVVACLPSARQNVISQINEPHFAYCDSIIL